MYQPILLKIVFSILIIVVLHAISFSQSGILLSKRRTFDTVSKAFVVPLYERDSKRWFKDSFIIQECPAVKFMLDSLGKEYYRTFVNGYLFIDVRNRVYYQYNSFSDTATIQKKYFEVDNAKGSLAFKFWVYKDFIDLRNIFPVADTVFNEKKYKRYREQKVYPTPEGNEKGDYTYYLDCGEKNTFFTYNKALTEMTGCPMLRSHWYSSDNNTEWFNELIYISTSLTSEELKVFAAWEKNLKKFPVEK